MRANYHTATSVALLFLLACLLLIGVSWAQSAPSPPVATEVQTAATAPPVNPAGEKSFWDGVADFFTLIGRWLTDLWVSLVGGQNPPALTTAVSPRKAAAGNEPEFTGADCAEDSALWVELRANEDWETLRELESYCGWRASFRRLIIADPAQCNMENMIGCLSMEVPPVFCDFYFEFCEHPTRDEVEAEIARREEENRRREEETVGQEAAGRALDRICTAEELATMQADGAEEMAEVMLARCQEEGYDVNEVEVFEAYARIMLERAPEMEEQARIYREHAADERWRERERANREDVFYYGDEQITFGTLCQTGFENNWQHEMDYSEDLCDGFDATLGDGGDFTRRFTSTDWSSSHLHRDSDLWLDEGGIDAVDIAFVHSHGIATSPGDDFDAGAAVILAGYHDGDYSVSTDWRAGDYGNGMFDTIGKSAVLSVHACKTMQHDRYTVDRWLNTFQGGLVVATGSHGIPLLGETTDEVGA